MIMLDCSNTSELWLLRTYFDDDARWNALEAGARKTRSCLPEAALVVSSDQIQCHQRIRRIMTRLATRAQANSQLYVAIADKQTFGHLDHLLLTIDCSQVGATAGQLRLLRLPPQQAFLLGAADRSGSSRRVVEPISAEPQRHPATYLPPPAAPAAPVAVNLSALVADAIRTSLLWKAGMTPSRVHEVGN